MVLGTRDSTNLVCCGTFMNSYIINHKQKRKKFHSTIENIQLVVVCHVHFSLPSETSHTTAV